MRYILTPTLLITLTIIFAPLAPRIAHAADGINFVTIARLSDTDTLCFKDVHALEEGQRSDPADEVAAGMEAAAMGDISEVAARFQGIRREDVVARQGLTPC